MIGQGLRAHTLSAVYTEINSRKNKKLFCDKGDKKPLHKVCTVHLYLLYLMYEYTLPIEQYAYGFVYIYFYDACSLIDESPTLENKTV